MKKPQEDETRVNEAIDVPQVRLINHEGENIGVIDTREALEMADNEGLDLVEIAGNVSPPVAKIMNYGKLRYEKQKKKQENKRKQKTVQIKEIKVRPNIETHDYQVKLSAAKRFIDAGHKVKLTLRFRGRELSHREIGEDLVKRFVQDTEEFAKTESPVKMEERQIAVMLISNK
ncbi:MAG: translation initiation factor IF-3 [Alphaproteobacteria bacterium]|nr:translation initiation factor IF-3 [Alphaproteobacteria bacterium]